MKQIKLLNGFVYLKYFDEEYSWCIQDEDRKQQYFLLNLVTREHFKKDILPLIRNRECHISDEDYTYIKTFKQNPKENIIVPLIRPPGITLKDYQEDAVNKLLTYKKFALFLGTGTGKTLIAISLLLSREIKSALIVTPAKVVGQYKKELDKYIPNNSYIVTNYEQLHKYVTTPFDCLILDESHKAKSYMSNINVLCRTIASKTKYVYLFTGTPQDKNRHEILSQLAILDLRVMPVKTKTLERYFRIDDYYNPKSEKREFSNELTSIIKEYTWGKQSDSVLELPKENSIIYSCPHPTKYYDVLYNRKAIIQDDLYCVADNKAKLRLFLREICSGCISWKDIYETPVKTESFTSPKREALKELINKIDKAIIYYEFTASLTEIEGVLKEQNKKYVVVNGACSVKRSASLIDSFKIGEVDYLVIQSASGNAGLDLTNVNNIIFYALPESYIVFHQCKSRIRRYGQTKECNYYYLLCKDTIEELIYTTLKKKKSFTDKVFKNYL